LGNTFSMLAIPWFVLATGGSASQTGLTVAVGTVPYILVGIFGGVIVDRVGPKRTAIVSDLCSGLSVAMIPLLHATIGLEFWQLLVLVFLGALLDGPGNTARLALFPDLIHRSGIDQERANTWFTLTVRIAGVLGAPLAGVLIAALGSTTLLWMNAGSFALAAVITLVAIPDIRVIQAAVPSNTAGGRAAPVRTYLRDVRDGFRFLFNHRLLFAMVATSSLGTLLAEPIYGVILPVYANEVLGGAAQLGFIFGALGAGSIVGNVLYLGHCQSFPARGDSRRRFHYPGALLRGLPHHADVVDRRAGHLYRSRGAGTEQPDGDVDFPGAGATRDARPGVWGAQCYCCLRVSGGTGGLRWTALLHRD
jgi:MFS family permease